MSRTDMLKPLNDLAYCCECAAQNDTGELKSQLSELCRLIHAKEPGYEADEIQMALPKLECALANYRLSNRDQGAMLLVSISRDWWNVVGP